MPIRTVTPLEYITTPRPQLEWLVKGLIPKPGYLLLMGPPKAGKSFLAWSIAARVAQGKSVLGFKGTGIPQRVLYIQLDTKEAAWAERIRNFHNAGETVDIVNFRLVHPDDMLLPMLVTSSSGVGFVREVVKETAPKLVVVDVLRELHQEDENDSTAMKKVFDAMEPLFAGLSVLLIHHTRKMSAEDWASPDPVTLARGSSYITGRVDGYWLLYGSAPNRKLHFESRFQESSLLTAVQDPATGLFTFPELAPQPALLAKLLEICERHPDRKHSDLWKIANSQLGVSRSAYYRMMHEMPCIHSSNG